VASYCGSVAPPIGLPFKYHWLPVAFDDVSVTFPPAQNVVGPPGVMVGVAGGVQPTATISNPTIAQVSTSSAPFSQ
jgi:hypothetical protein